MQYDGKEKLGEAIAGLCSLSPKSQAQIARLIKQAKDALGIVSKSKNLPNDVKLSIWQWHYDRLQSTANEAVNIISQHDSGESVNIISQPDSVMGDDGGVYNVKQSDDFSQAHFSVTVAGKRTTVMLEGYLVTALQRKHGLTGNMAISAWIGQAIKNDGVRFDAGAPLTRQVKRLIVESFV